jgi:hypothetical protein
MSHYRHISVLAALSNAIEIIMKLQNNAFLKDGRLLSYQQPGFRTHHSNSTALLKITNDLLIATDERLLSLLVLLDFPKAFDSGIELVRLYNLSGQSDYVVPQRS